MLFQAILKGIVIPLLFSCILLLLLLSTVMYL